MMKILDELKRIKTKEFWGEVFYWSVIKWSGKKTQPIADKDWLPILTSALLGFLFIILVIFSVTIYKMLKG